jgi:hypothetical protein
MLCMRISMLMLISMINLGVIKNKCKGRKDIDEGNYLLVWYFLLFFILLFYLLLQSNIFIKLNINFFIHF